MSYIIFNVVIAETWIKDKKRIFYNLANFVKEDILSDLQQATSVSQHSLAPFDTQDERPRNVRIKVDDWIPLIRNSISNEFLFKSSHSSVMKIQCCILTSYWCVIYALFTLFIFFYCFFFILFSIFACSVRRMYLLLVQT